MRMAVQFRMGFPGDGCCSCIVDVLQSMTIITRIQIELSSMIHCTRFLCVTRKILINVSFSRLYNWNCANSKWYHSSGCARFYSVSFVENNFGYVLNVMMSRASLLQFLFCILFKQYSFAYCWTLWGFTSRKKQMNITWRICWLHVQVVIHGRSFSKRLIVVTPSSAGCGFQK